MMQEPVKPATNRLLIRPRFRGNRPLMCSWWPQHITSQSDVTSGQELQGELSRCRQAASFKQCKNKDTCQIQNCRQLDLRVRHQRQNSHPGNRLN